MIKLKKPIVRIENFGYRYPNTTKLALDNISLTINEGEFIGIIGGNKAGKSTLCQAMVGVLPHLIGGDWVGDIFVDEVSVSDTKGEQATKVIGIVFQDAESQFTQETVEDEIAFSMCNFGYSRELMVERIKEAAEACGLLGMLDRSPFKLSGGQQQRLAVACILALQPKVIILDESTSQLDPLGRDDVFSLVTKLHKKGTTVIMVDHNIEKIAEYVDKVIVLYDGKVEEYDDVKEVFQKKKRLKEINVRIPQVTSAAIDLKEKIKEEVSPIKLLDAIEIFSKAMGEYEKNVEYNN